MEASWEWLSDELFCVTLVGSGCIKGSNKYRAGVWTEPEFGQSNQNFVGCGRIGYRVLKLEKEVARRGRE